MFREKLTFAKAIDSINHYPKKPEPPVIRIDLFEILLSSGKQLLQIKPRSLEML